MEKLGAGDPMGVPPGFLLRGRIGAYRLIARLGAGGMGNVYLARSDRGRTVAVKLVRRELAQQEEFRARFRQEVQAARRVGGHWTAPVLDADTEAEIPWVATGYVAGPTLQTVVSHDHGALPERSVRILAAGLAHALQDIHAAGLIHRDLKPSNVLVTIDGPRVIDFGITRALETVTAAGLTRTGALVGSPGFMAPEQVRGDRITPACDVFCLGSVLAYAATGVLPFGTADSGVHALLFRIAEEDPDLRGIPEDLADLVRDCLRKDPAARPTPAQILERTGAGDTVSGGRTRDPWLPSALVAQLGRHAVRLLDAENPEEGTGPAAPAPAQTPPHAGGRTPATPPAAASATSTPAPEGQAPGGGGHAPGAGGPAPADGGWLPGGVPAPGAGGQAAGGHGWPPGGDGQVPGDGGRPPGAGQAPGAEGQAPGAEGHVPGGGGHAAGAVGGAVAGAGGAMQGAGDAMQGAGGAVNGAGGPVNGAAAGFGPGAAEASADLTKRPPADAPASPEHAPAPDASDGSTPPP
ncbi:serine/threonine-protein kinase, partial [Streptomyces caeni]